MASAGESTLTHALLAKALGVTVTTIKSYRRKFPEFFRTASLGKPIRFPAETLELCRAIHHHFKRGLSVEETRRQLAQKFEAAAPLPDQDPAPAPQPAAVSENTSLDRIEDLLEGLFTLQNRTHSLMAELLAKLDTVADRLGQTQGASGEAAGAPADASPDTEQAHPVFRDVPRLGDESPSAQGQRPPAELLGMPVVVHSSGGDFLGVTSPTGRPFTLEQFEAFLVRRAKDDASFSSAWVRQGQQWTLRLEGAHAGQDETREHHFFQAVTPRGNTVARFASLSVNGNPASDADLQAFLRQVKESLAS